MPVTLKEGLIPVAKLMQINKVVHPRVDSKYLLKRRELYKAKDNAGYERCIKESFFKSIQVAASGYKALNDILGVNQGLVQKSMFTYSMDLDLRDVLEDFFKKSVSP